MSGVAFLRCLAAAALLVAVAHGQSTVGSALTGQSGASFPGACPISKLSDVIVTTIATLPESTTGPLTLAYSAASNYPFGNPTRGFSTSPSWNLFLNNTATYFSAPNGRKLLQAVSGLKFFGECKQNLLTLQATCSFVFDYSTRRLLDLLSKATPAGGIPLGGTLTFQFCTLALGNSQVSSPTCFESRGGTPRPVIVKISSKEPADVIPPIGFNACYKDVVGSPYKCLAFAIIQSCADSSQLAVGAPILAPTSGGVPYTPASTTGAATVSGSAGTMGPPGSQSLANGQGRSAVNPGTGTGSSSGFTTPGASAQGGSSTGSSTQPSYNIVPNSAGQAAAQQAGASFQTTQQVYNQGAQVVGQGAKQAKQDYQANLQQQKQVGRRRLADRD